MRALDEALEEFVVIDASVAPHIDPGQLDRMWLSGVDAFNWTVCNPAANRKEALASMGAAVDLIEGDDRFRLIKNADDIRDAKADRRVGFIFGPQNAAYLEEDVAGTLDEAYALGLRIQQITYSEDNAFGSGCLGSDDGLTAAGRDLIRQLNDLSIVVDLSHASEKTMLDAAAVTEQPLIVSHIGSREVWPSPRNVTDAAASAVAETGGVIGATLWSPIVGPTNGSQPTVDDYLRHVDHLCELVGVDHVGFASDHSEGAPRAEWERSFGSGGRYARLLEGLDAWYDYDSRYVRGAPGCMGVGAVLRAIGSHRSVSELEQIAGANFLRVLGDVWRQAER